MTPQELVRMKEIRLWLVVLLLVGVVLGVGLTEMFHTLSLSPALLVLGVLGISFAAAVVNSRR